jgi:hypothetical protein
MMTAQSINQRFADPAISLRIKVASPTSPWLKAFSTR